MSQNDIEKPVIMSIDDDPITLNVLVSMLKNEYSVRLFTSGRVALTYLADHHVDLILLDRQMPDMLGVEVLKALRNNPDTKDIPTIILTSIADSDSEAEALDYGAADYITKPIHRGSLMMRVRLQLELQTHRKALEQLVEERTHSLRQAYEILKDREEVTLSMLAKATDLRDHDTGDHIERTTEFSRIIAEHLYGNPADGYNISRRLADDIVRSTKLHDLGKIALPDSILLKPGRLTAEEFSLVKKHTEYAERFLSGFMQKKTDSFLATARDISYAHHEKWDGSGYPLGIQGTEIPLSARIVAIGDVYDALTSVRPYKRALSHEEAAQIIMESSGTHFDPFLVGIFDRFKNDFRDVVEGSGKTRN